MRSDAVSCEKLIGDLKAHRAALGWSVKEVGNRIGLDETVIAQWEGGDASPRLDAVANWASAFGLALALMPAEAIARSGLHVDWQARRICVDGTPVRLTPTEWKALERLAAAPGELVPHLDLFRHLHGEDETYRAESTAIRVLITKLRRLLPPLRIEAKWGRGYVISGIASSSPVAAPRDGVAEWPVEPLAPLSDTRREPRTMSLSMIELARNAIRRKPVEISHVEVRRAPAVRPNSRRAEELTAIERFLAERGVTRCPDVATIQYAPLPSLVWDKMKRKWVRPTVAG